MKSNKNKGFTMIELIVIITIMTVLLGVLVPSLNAIIGYRITRITNSIAGALDETKTQAMSRLVGEVRLSQEGKNCYITYYLHRGKQAGVVEQEEEKVEVGNVTIHYTTADGETHTLDEDGIILTYNREDGSFRPIQTQVVSSREVNDAIAGRRNVVFNDSADSYCTSIQIGNRIRKRVITMYPETGQYEITEGNTDD